MWRGTGSRCVKTSKPLTRAAPDVGLASVQSTLMVVLLPAPLGPRNPKTSPGGTVNDTPRTASTSPYDLTRSTTSMAGAVEAVMARHRTHYSRCTSTVDVSCMIHVEASSPGLRERKKRAARQAIAGTARRLFA